MGLSISAILLSLLLVTLSGCEQPPPASPPAWEYLPPVREDTIGRLQVDGTQAYLNGRPVTNGAYIRAGDLLSTGANTSARVMLNGGGHVQLDENTDPEFTLVRQGACVLVKFAHGRGLLKSVQCVEAQAGPLAVVLKSLVNLQTTGEAAQVTVLEGRIEVTAPQSALVEKFQQYSVSGAGAANLVTLTPEQAQSTAAWKNRFFRAPAGQAGEGVSPGAVVGIGAVVGAGLWELFHHRSGSSHPPPQTHPAPAAAPAAQSAAPPAVAPATPPVAVPATTPAAPPAVSPAPPRTPVNTDANPNGDGIR